MLPSDGRAASGDAGARLRRAERLRRGSEYRRVYDKATALHGRALVVFVLETPGESLGAGFVAGRRVGGSVQRNRARRVLKESYRSLKNHLPAQGFQMVFVARAPCAARKTAEVLLEMRELLGRAGVLRQ